MTGPDPGGEVDLSDLTLVIIVWDVAMGSPPELQAWGGRVVAMPPWKLPLPARGTLFGVRGFSRQSTMDLNGDGNADLVWEWVLQGDVDPVDQFVDNLTAPYGNPGWLSAPARAAVKAMVQRLYTEGVPTATIASQVPLFVQAVVTEYQARQGAG